MEIFLLGLLVVSVLTGLITEAIKNLCNEHRWNYYANTLAGAVAVIIALLLGVAYVIWTGAAVSAQIVIAIIALIIMGWLCAMCGYDKVVQAISQFQTYGKGD
ncbi:MAG: aminopeptidase [Lachnospiraceae bacterium]|nr:aminopeptidase [Lachnospiraceae bacterium]